jgi:hypothetical protein
MRAAITLLYPASALALPENPWALEAAAVAHAGIATLTWPADAAAIAATAPGTELLYRGPALTATQYAALESAVAAGGRKLMTAAQDYLRAQQMPGWHAPLADYGAESRVLPRSHSGQLPKVLDKLGWWPLDLRAYSEYDGGQRLRCANAAEAQAHAAARLATIDDGVSGLVLSRHEPMIAGSERRYFVWHQNVWPHPNAPDEATALARTVTRHFWHLFYSVDVAQRSDGRWRLVNLNDGQAAALQEWPAELFAEYLALSLNPSTLLS